MSSIASWRRHGTLTRASHQYRWDVQGLMKAGGRPQPGETRCVMSIYGEARGERADVKTGWLFGSTWLDGKPDP